MGGHKPPDGDAEDEATLVAGAPDESATLVGSLEGPAADGDDATFLAASARRPAPEPAESDPDAAVAEMDPVKVSNPSGAGVPPPEVPDRPAGVNKSVLDVALALPRGMPFAVSLGLHAAVFAAALILPRVFSRPPPLRKPIIARMVALGKPRDQRLLPRKEEPPPPGGAPRSAASVPAAPPGAKQPAKVAAAKPAPPAPKPLSRKELMERALAGVSSNVAREKRDHPPEERVGQETGSPDGTAESAEEGDAYFSAVQAAILANYVLPSIISERERMSLKATVVAWIARDGAIVRYEFEKRSGNRFFDEALERAIKRTRVPPPPPERERAVRDVGVALVFTP